MLKKYSPFPWNLRLKYFDGFVPTGSGTTRPRGIYLSLARFDNPQGFSTDHLNCYIFITMATYPHKIVGRYVATICQKEDYTFSVLITFAEYLPSIPSLSFVSLAIRLLAFSLALPMSSGSELISL
jgi:hypothetical protein